MSDVISIDRNGAAAREALERFVSSGGVVIFPSDGLYGLACDPLNPAAVDRINVIKGRDPGKPSAVMYFLPLAMREVVEDLTPIVRAAVAELLPGPVTLVVDNPERRYPLACGDDPDRLGIRLIEGPLAGVMTPVLQTSANPAGEPPPARLDEVPDNIRSQADLAIDGGELSGSPSTVIDLTEIDAGGAWKVVREGAMPYSEIEEALTGIDLG